MSKRVTPKGTTDPDELAGTDQPARGRPPRRVRGAFGRMRAQDRLDGGEALGADIAIDGAGVVAGGGQQALHIGRAHGRGSGRFPASNLRDAGAAADSLSRARPRRTHSGGAWVKDPGGWIIPGIGGGGQAFPARGDVRRGTPIQSRKHACH